MDKLPHIIQLFCIIFFIAKLCDGSAGWQVALIEQLIKLNTI